MDALQIAAVHRPRSVKEWAYRCGVSRWTMDRYCSNVWSVAPGEILLALRREEERVLVARGVPASERWRLLGYANRATYLRAVRTGRLGSRTERHPPATECASPRADAAR